MKLQNKKIIASILFLVISFVCVAQEDMPAPATGGGNQPIPPPPPGTPIDSGVYIVAGLALAYGAYKKRKALLK
ncbi:hypothetical protein [Mangrovimonas spongiae]|uniref:LPXTG cell wall anchor domain-containing protein n=1 Tax=Mangrovimonas spongiae TaxID=2494697 RepID=A0A3R9NR00_9FLAO|nr:hypothetical protein [Mangrovimonas spongiae]RSK41573.1 hypothetical protein EJA19_01485 [Mangrovimonas spongiae]